MRTITVKTEMTYEDFEPWSGARACWQKVEAAGKLPELWELIADFFPEGCSETDINDFVWFEDDFYFPILGIKWEDD